MTIRISIINNAQQICAALPAQMDMPTLQVENVSGCVGRMCWNPITVRFAEQDSMSRFISSQIKHQLDWFADPSEKHKFSMLVEYKNEPNCLVHVNGCWITKHEVTDAQEHMLVIQCDHCRMIVK